MTRGRGGSGAEVSEFRGDERNIALSRISFKCIKIAVTKSYIINCVTALKYV